MTELSTTTKYLNINTHQIWKWKVVARKEKAETYSSIILESTYICESEEPFIRWELNPNFLFQLGGVRTLKIGTEKGLLSKVKMPKTEQYTIITILLTYNELDHSLPACVPVSTNF
jgi:hypothetical protein